MHQTQKLGMGLDGESNPGPFSLPTMLHPTEPHGPGHSHGTCGKHKTLGPTLDPYWQNLQFNKSPSSFIYSSLRSTILYYYSSHIKKNFFPPDHESLKIRTPEKTVTPNVGFREQRTNCIQLDDTLEKSNKGQKSKNSQAVNANAGSARKSVHNPRLFRYPL